MDVDTQTIMDRLRKVPEGKLSAMGACVFAGGFSFGVEEAGFHVAGHLECPSMALGVESAKNRWAVALHDHQKWQDWTRQLVIHKIPPPDFLYMNPPCSAYAKNGKRNGLDDPIMSYVQACHDLILQMNPPTACWELVTGIWTRDEEYVRDLAATLSDISGYHVYIVLTTSAVHGGFQHRERFHFFASKYEIDWQALLDSEPPERRGWRPLSEALAMVPENAPNHMSSLGNTQLEKLVQFCPPGTYFNQLPDDIYATHYRRKGGIYWKPGDRKPGVSRMRAMRDKPCPVIIGGMAIAHPTEDRFLSARESATVMGFPTDYVLSKSKSVAFKEVGRGLCTHTAAFIARGAKQGLMNRKPASPGVTVVDFLPLAEVPQLSSSQEYKIEWAKANGIPWGKRTPARKHAAPRKRTTKVVYVVGSVPEWFIDGVLPSGALITGEAGAQADITVGFASTQAEVFQVLVGLKSGDLLCVPDGVLPPGISLPVDVVKSTDLVQRVMLALGVDMKRMLIERINNVSDSIVMELLDALDELENLAEMDSDGSDGSDSDGSDGSDGTEGEE